MSPVDVELVMSAAEQTPVAQEYRVNRIALPPSGRLRSSGLIFRFQIRANKRACRGCGRLGPVRSGVPSPKVFTTSDESRNPTCCQSLALCNIEQSPWILASSILRSLAQYPTRACPKLGSLRIPMREPTGENRRLHKLAPSVRQNPGQ